MNYKDFKIDPFGLLIGHTWYEVGLIEDAINEYQVKAFLEIGIYRGGLAAFMYMRCQLNPNFKYFGIELSEIHTNIFLKSLVQKHENASMLFWDAYTGEAIEATRTWLNKCGRPAFIYADGGNKKNDLRYYAPLARPGDIIAVHDYGVYDRAEISPGEAFNIMSNPPYEPFDTRRWEGTRIFSWRRF